MSIQTFTINGHDIEVEVESVESGGPQCAPSVDWEIVGELPEGVRESEVESKVIDDAKEHVSSYPYRR